MNIISHLKTLIDIFKDANYSIQLIPSPNGHSSRLIVISRNPSLLTIACTTTSNCTFHLVECFTIVRLYWDI